jgi:serine/threonine-protein phosphatase 2A regulatory subunit B'
MNVRKMFIEMDENLFKECQLKFQEDEAKAREIEGKREVIWKHLEVVATSSGPSEEPIVVGQT